MKRTLNHENFWLIKGEDNFQNYIFAKPAHNGFTKLAYLIGHDLSDEEIDEIIEKFNKNELEVHKGDLCNFFDMAYINKTVWNLFTIA